jgi:hypothetical protein
MRQTLLALGTAGLSFNDRNLPPRYPRELTASLSDRNCTGLLIADVTQLSDLHKNSCFTTRQQQKFEFSSKEFK